MRVLVLGGAGMLGHKVFQVLSARFPDTWCTVREERGDPLLERVDLLATDRTLTEVDAMRIDQVEGTIAELRPDAVVNCIGVIKQRGEAKAAIPSITVNSLLPHRLAAAAARHGGRLVHFSTDCVFSGERGDYREDDFPDAADFYGRSKLLGEVADENALTLRTSIIGRELRTHRSLLDWFLSQEGGTVHGYTRVWWSGVTTNHLAEMVAEILQRHPLLHGVYQLAGRKINKHDLLVGIRSAYGAAIEILPDDNAVLDRSLSGERLREAIGYEPPPWADLLAQLAADPSPYQRWASSR
jgi:dTDP-4-dehydrorhamnose reductase